MELKSYGQDKYSRLKEEGLVLILGEVACKEIRRKVNEPEGYLPALRWAARGLSAEDASRKANVIWKCRRTVDKKGTFSFS